MTAVAASGRWAAGSKTAEFERQFAAWWGIRECVLVNSGSSANLLALSALTSPSLGDRRLKPGDEVITAACGFPTKANITAIGIKKNSPRPSKNGTT